MDGKRFLGDVTAGLTVSLPLFHLELHLVPCLEEVHLQA